MSLINTLVGPVTGLLDKVIEDKDQKAKFAYHFVIQPLLVFVLTVLGLELPELPEFDMSTLLTTLGGLLGIGGLRSYEKTKGLTK